MTLPENLSRLSGSLGNKLVDNMQQMTLDRIGDLGLENADKNLKKIQSGKSIKDLRNTDIAKIDKSVIIAAGPSIKRNNPVGVLKSSEYAGNIVATDSALYYCLKNGITPDLIVTLDPHPTRIVRWLGDPALTEDKLKADDYFTRQDMDTDFSAQLETNEAIIKLLDKEGNKIKIALSSSSSEAVVNRVIGIGMDIYWWNPMYDDPEQKNSVTMKLFKSNNLPCLNAGGNVGAACWMMCDSVLDSKKVALTGMDFAYYADTPFEKTQYYHEAVALVGKENLDSIYIPLFNPITKTWFYSDPAYMWYKKILLEMISDGDCDTYNCTGGGIVFGDGINFCELEIFINN